MKIDTQAQLKALVGTIGFHEGPNNENPFSVWQGIHNAAWCDSEAQWGAVEHGGFDGWADPRVQCQFGRKGDAYCPSTIAHAKALGLWRPKGSGYDPEPGDQELFDWNGNGVADHIGTRLTKRRPDGTHVNEEGNHNDAAEYVTRDDTYVMGHVALSTLNQAAVPAPAPHQPGPGETAPIQPANPGQAPATSPPAYQDPPLSGGPNPHYDARVETFQRRLQERGWSIKVDGLFGLVTEQIVRQFQKQKGLRIDGVVGPQTWAAFWSAPVS